MDTSTKANAASCAPIGEKSGRTRETFAAITATFARIAASADRMCVNIARTGAKALRGRNYAPIARRLKETRARSAAIVVTFALTSAIGVATRVITGAIDGKPGT